jgi:hypothetical protein
MGEADDRGAVFIVAIRRFLSARFVVVIRAGGSKYALHGAAAEPGGGDAGHACK